MAPSRHSTLGFLPEESIVGSAQRVVLISHHRWQSDFGGQPDVLGATLRLNGYRHTIVGVVPDGVVSRRVPLEPDIWVPVASVGDGAATSAETLEFRDRRSFLIGGRLIRGLA